MKLAGFEPVFLWAMAQGFTTRITYTTLICNNWKIRLYRVALAGTNFVYLASNDKSSFNVSAHHQNFIRIVLKGHFGQERKLLIRRNWKCQSFEKFTLKTDQLFRENAPNLFAFYPFYFLMGPNIKVGSSILKRWLHKAAAKSQRFGKSREPSQPLIPHQLLWQRKLLS